ncbi:MAG TPA: phosphoenolpyruvate-utilizing N-terminal domain-containing protein, partial [Burkholderiales bacterium]|nr:phosphoenolpyruvate-utilizing N-terminal domain-containing protein [Burkholderiales bacterium]
MNFVLHGHAVAGGITVGYAHLVATARLEVAHYEVPPEAVEAEVQRFDRAMQTAQQELQDLKAHIAADAPKELEAFLDLHRMILNDSALAVVPREIIRSRRANAEWALVQQMER